MVQERIAENLSPYIQNYVAAMVETICVRKHIALPEWLQKIEPLDQPVFASDLISLRLYLLTHAPLAFRRRNIFIDATIGDRV